ncbi:MAG TPA: phosphoribosyltransferase family protein [Brumimicrobium sp.]|nr:phosphoribosyltransferase family protein [Brumimicrobium sp.]
MRKLTQTNKPIHLLKNLIHGFLTLFYPHTCLLCVRELNQQDEFMCFSCRSELHFTYFEKYEEETVADEKFWGKYQIDNVYSLLYFEKGNSTQNILHQIKYKEGKGVGEYMGKLIGERIKDIEKYKSVDAIIPVPIHSKKKFSRGHNQSLIIAKGISQEMTINIADILKRVKNDASQTRKSKEERYENVKGKFAVKKNHTGPFNHVLIVDDVLTTGATLESVARTIRATFPNTKVSLATIAIAHK